MFSSKKNAIGSLGRALTVESIVIVLFVTLFIYLRQTGMLNMDMGIEASDLKSTVAEYNEGWHFTSQSLESMPDDRVTVTYGPSVELPRGYYTVTVVYSCESRQKIILGSSEEYEPYIEAENVGLDPLLNVATYDFRIKNPVKNFEIRTEYDGAGALDISEIHVNKNSSGFKKTFVYLIFGFILFDIYLYNLVYIRKNKWIVVSLAGIVILSSLPLTVYMIHNGHDLWCHLMRIEGIADELRNGVFPVRLQSSWIAGNGYPISVFYGDLLLYFPALLRIMGFSVMEAYKGYILFINLITVLLSYYSFKTIIKEERIAVLMALGYSLSYYRMLNIFIRAAVGEYTAMAFFPLIAAALYLIYTDSRGDRKPDLKATVMLGAGMSLILLSHTLSVEMMVVVILVFSLINIKKTFKIRTILTYMTAAASCLLLSLYFIVPFVDYWFRKDVLITNGSTLMKIQDKGAYILQLFSFFEDPYVGDGSLVAGRSGYTPGMLLMVSLVMAVIMLIAGKADKKIKVTSLGAVILLFLATNVFPWDFIAYEFMAGKILTVVQYPWRYIAPAAAALSVLMGFVIAEAEKMFTRHKNTIYIVTAVMGISWMIVFLGQYIDGINDAKYISSSDVNHYGYRGGEFLRVDRYGEPVTSGEDGINVISDVVAINAEARILSRKGTSMDIECKTGNTPGIVTAPLYNYKGYQVKDSSGKVYDIFDDDFCRVSFKIPEGFNDTISIRFTEPWYWRLSEAVSLFTLIGLFIVMIVVKKKQAKAD